MESEVQKVQSGQNHNCVIKMNNKVYCWGERIKGKFNKPFHDDKYVVHITFGEWIWGVVVSNEFS